jgi:hypothetical protein
VVSNGRKPQQGAMLLPDDETMKKERYRQEIPT